MTSIKSQLFTSKFSKVGNFMIQSRHKQNSFIFLHSAYYRSKIREEPFFPCIIISDHFFRQLINFIDKIFDNLMSYLMVFFGFLFLKQISKNINILNSKIHSSISKWSMNMSCISSEVHITNTHFLNDSIVNKELRSPTYFKNVKLI